MDPSIGEMGVGLGTSPISPIEEGVQPHFGRSTESVTIRRSCVNWGVTPISFCAAPGSTRGAISCLRASGPFKIVTQERPSMHPDLVVGKQFPDLTLPDHRHQLTTLSELANGYPLILSFYRGYW
jgi:hypothetical protein